MKVKALTREQIQRRNERILRMALDRPWRASKKTKPSRAVIETNSSSHGTTYKIHKVTR